MRFIWHIFGIKSVGQNNLDNKHYRGGGKTKGGMERQLKNKLMEMGIFQGKGGVMKEIEEKRSEKQKENIAECSASVHTTTT